MWPGYPAGPHYPRTAEPVPGTLPALLKRERCPPARPASPLDSWAQGQTASLPSLGFPACHPRGGRRQAGARLRRETAKAGLVPAAPSITAVRVASRVVPSAASGEKEMAIWCLPIHTPWGSASERKTVGKAAEGEREEVQVWGAGPGALCILPGAQDYSGVRATQARMCSIHRNGARPALWGPGGHVGQGQRGPAEPPRA